MSYKIRNISILFVFIFTASLPPQALRAEASPDSPGFAEKKALIKDFRPDPYFVEGEVIVKYKKSSINLKKSAGRKKAENFSITKSLEKAGEIPDSNIQLFKSPKTTEQTLANLKNDPDVEFAEPN